jgi:hypothetical protein
MGEPVSERAHYVAVSSSAGADLFLIQQGRLERAGIVSVIWRRPDPATMKRDSPIGKARARLRRALGQTIASLVVLAL